jgi:4-hydroxy-tetrahydrodipicolinate synthase
LTKYKALELKGVFPPAITIFKCNEEIDEQATRDHIDFLIENGVHGIIACGSTGEFFNLTVKERKKVIDLFIDHINGRVPLFAGTHACSTRETIELSRYAEDAGVDGLLIVPPYYYKPNDDEIYEHYKRIAESVNIPIMLYNNPWTSGVYVKPQMLVKMANEEIINYVKETHGDVAMVHEIILLGGGKKPIVFFGRDENAFEAFIIGATGWVSGAANVTTKLQVELFKYVVEKRDIEKGKELYFKLLPWFLLTERKGRWIAYIKEALEVIGRNAGKPRRPILPLKDYEKKELTNILTTIFSQMHTHES